MGSSVGELYLAKGWGLITDYTTESGETHTINLEFEISLEDENSTIYDGEINIIDENINDNF